MTMTRPKWGFACVSLISLAIGCAFGSALPTRKLAAQPAPNGWHCYELDPGSILEQPRILDSSKGFHGPQGIGQLTADLDRVAAHAPAGTVYSPPTRTSQYVCVKGSATM